MIIAPKDFPILVTDAQSTAALAILRSLGPLGYKVHVIGESTDMICFSSRWAAHKTLCPAYASPEFEEWIFKFIKENRIRLILPTERFLMRLRPRLEEILPLLYARVSLETLETSMSKTRLFRSFQDSSDPRLRENLPPFEVLDLDAHSLPSLDELDSWPKPLFLKFDAMESRAGAASQVISVPNSSEVKRVLAEQSKHYRSVLLQGFAQGRGAGAFILRWDKKLVARFGHQRLHEVPHKGGPSSLRKAYFDEALFKDALLRAEALDWEGPAMFEYRQDPMSGKFQLMELNARFWGSLHLALYAGVDFPAKLADLARGADVSPQMSFDENVIARLTVPGEIQHVWSVIKDPNCTLWMKVSKIIEALWLFVKPGVRSDLAYPGDRLVFFAAARAYFISFFRKKA